jgi:hypothetical protein
VVLVAERNRLLRGKRAALRRQHLVGEDRGGRHSEDSSDEDKTDAQDCRRIEDLGHGPPQISFITWA